MARLQLPDNEILAEALPLLRSKPTGSRVYKAFEQSGYSIDIDEAYLKENGSFTAYIDNVGRRIVTGREGLRHAFETARLMGHEMRHIEQLQVLGIESNWSDDLPTVLRWSRIVEADAYAHDALIAVENVLEDPARKKVMDFIRPFPVRLKVFETAAAGREALTNGKALAAGFDAFFDLPKARKHYEDHWLEQHEKLSNTRLRGNLNRSRSADDFIRKLAPEGEIPYVYSHFPDLDMTQPRYAGVYPETLERLRAFEQRLRSLGRKIEEGAYELPVYAPAPITKKRERTEFRKRAERALEMLRDRGPHEPAPAASQATLTPT